MLNNDTLFEICKYLEHNDIINVHLALNIPMQLNIIRLLNKYYKCPTCNKYEKVLYECDNCNIKNCLYCSTICKKYNVTVCNIYNCEKPYDDNKTEKEYEIVNSKSECPHNCKSMINKYNCRNHNIKCGLCNKKSACECKQGVRCISCLWMLCKYCGKCGICDNCDL